MPLSLHYRFVSTPPVSSSSTSHMLNLTTLMDRSFNPHLEAPFLIFNVSFQPLQYHLSSCCDIDLPYHSRCISMKLSRHMKANPPLSPSKLATFRFNTFGLLIIPCCAANPPPHNRCISIETLPSHESLPPLSTFRFNPFYPGCAVSELLAASGKDIKE